MTQKNPLILRVGENVNHHRVGDVKHCTHCDKEIVIGRSEIVARLSNRHRLHYCLECAKDLNII